MTVVDAAAVVLEPGQSVDIALKRLARQVQRAGILGEVRRRAAFAPPGVRRRRKAHRARQRAAKAAAKHAAQRGGDDRE